MFNYVKNSLSKLIKSRLIVLVVLFALLAGILIQRLYTMQIINGEKYLTDFTMQIKKETTLKSTRGKFMTATEMRLHTTSSHIMSPMKM